MKRLFIITFFFTALSVDVSAQNWGVNTFGQFTNEAVDVEVDNSGNYYTTGYVTGETAFNTANVVPSALGNGDVYVAKYSTTGSLIWVKTFGGNFSDRGTDLAVCSDGSIVVTGQFFGLVNFGLTSLSSVSNSKDIFIAKLDNSGNVIWALQEGGAMAENAYGIAVDHQNNVVLTGQFQGQASIGNSTFTSAIDPNTNVYSFDFFVSKYDSNGNPLWEKNGFAEYEDRGLAVSIDNQNNIFFTGQFSKDLVFAGQTYLNNGYNIGFLCKMNASGTLQFFNQMKAGMVIPYDLEINTDNEVIVIGDFLGNMNYYDASGIHSVQNPFTKQIFVLKTANSGAYNWNYTLGSDNEVSARAISIDPHKDVFVTGFFKCGLSQVHDTATAHFNSVGYKDAYLLKVNNQGNYEYIKHFGGKMDDEGQGIALNQNDKPVICGSFTKDLNFAFDNNFSIPTGNSNYALNDYASINDPGHLYLHGDSTRNSFLVSNVNASYGDLNYYIPSTSDSLVGYIVPAADTIHFCASEILRYETLSGRHYGPSYSYEWSNGSTSDTAYIQTTNNYWVNVERSDQCAFDVDSVYAISEPIPALPLLTDNLGLYVNAPGIHFANYNFCYPDSVTVTYSDIEPGTTITTVWPNSSTSQVGAGPLLILEEGQYIVRASNQYCQTDGYFDFDLDYVIPYDDVDLGIEMNPSNLAGDSISICQGTQVYFGGVDYITNPDSSFICINQPWVLADWHINGGQYGNDNVQLVRTYFVPSVSGWYTVDLDLTKGYDNTCGIDTTQYHATRQFYITVKPLPAWSCGISGDNLLCPNGSVFLVASNPNPNFQWSGPGITWNNGTDSIEVNQSGLHHYSGTITDTITGCSKGFDFTHTITLKQGPTVLSDPADGIICPYDSIEMILPNTYLSYEWIGPNGDNLSNTNTCFGEDLGFYYCHVVDAESCSLTTPPYELREYTTPSISILPDEFLCEGESVNLIVAYSGSPSFQWSPINSSAEQITVNQPGFYSVSITQCGFTISDTIEIIDGTFSANISVSDTVLCFGDEAVIIGTPANGSYSWNNGQETGASYVVADTGVYYATVTNQYGCTTQTNAVTIHGVAGSIPPTIADAFVCAGSDVLLNDNSGFQLNWFDTDTNFLFTGSQNQLTNIQSDTSFLVAYTVNQCTPAYSLVVVELYQPLSSYEIAGDSIFCPNENALFSVNTTTETISWNVGGINYPNSNPVSIPYSVLNGNSIIAVTISNQCQSITISDSIFLTQPSTLTLTEDSLVVCADGEATVGVEEDLETVEWSWAFGSYEGDELTVLGSTQYGTITVSGTDLNGCPTETTSLTVTTSGLQFSINADFSNYCVGDSGIVTVSTNADSLQWSTPIGLMDTLSFGLNINSGTTGWYHLTLWDNIGCVYTDSVFVPMYEYASLNILPDSIFCINDVLTFYFPNDTNAYSWTTYGNSTEIPILFDQDLILNVTTPQGCTSSDTLVVHTVDCENLLPNFITPNGDGANDVFIIDDAYAQAKNELVILNRYGNVLLNVSPYRNDFDGGELTDGVYFYIYYPQGKEAPELMRQGFLHLIR